MKSDFGAIVLAGGKSTRMGFPKPFLEIDGLTLLERIHTVYEFICDPVIVVLNNAYASGEWKRVYEQHAAKMKIVLNSFPDKGRSYSIRLGLEQVQNSAHCFIQNTDNPVSDETVKGMMACAIPEGYVVPVSNNKTGHPVLISRPVINDFLKCSVNDFALNTFLSRYKRICVEVNSSLIHTNLNEPKQVSEFKNQLKHEQY